MHAGILMGAVLLGVLINKASIPSARVVFSDVCLLTSRNGEPMLILRIGNTRGNFLLNPEIRVGYLKVRPLTTPPPAPLPPLHRRDLHPVVPHQTRMILVDPARLHCSTHARIRLLHPARTTQNHPKPPQTPRTTPASRTVTSGDAPQLEATVEGENIMRMSRIELDEPPAMAPCINIACPIGPDSPLWGKTHADLENEGAAIYVALAATDNQHFQEVYARRFYLVQVSLPYRPGLPPTSAQLLPTVPSQLLLPTVQPYHNGPTDHVATASVLSDLWVLAQTVSQIVQRLISTQ